MGVRLTEQQFNYFRTFGFAVFRQLLTPEEVKRYSEEFNKGLDYWLDDNRRHNQKNHYALLMYETTPFIAALHGDPRFADNAEQLLGKPVIGASANGNYWWKGDTQWHPDARSLGFEGVKFVIYLEPRDATNGALRLIPGSHRPPYYHQLSRDPSEALGVRPEEVPCCVFESQPGDVLAFNLACWHAAFGGDDFRRQGVMVYYEDPQTPELTQEVIELILHAKKNAADKYGQPHWFPQYWRLIDNSHHQRWVRRLAELGVLD